MVQKSLSSKALINKQEKVSVCMIAMKNWINWMCMLFSDKFHLFQQGSSRAQLQNYLHRFKKNSINFSIGEIFLRSSSPSFTDFFQFPQPKSVFFQLMWSFAEAHELSDITQWISFLFKRSRLCFPPRVFTFFSFILQGPRVGKVRLFFVFYESCSENI